jgi:hypothetical protein
MFRQLVNAQDSPIRLDYPSGAHYMCLKRQRDRNDNTVGLYWRIFYVVKTGQEAKSVWKRGWHPKKVPPSIIRKMDDSNLSRFREQNEIAKAIHSAREALVKKKLRIAGTIQSFERDDPSRMERAERLLDEFML